MSEYRYEPPVPPYGSPERGDQKCPVPLTVYVDDASEGVAAPAVTDRVAAQVHEFLSGSHLGGPWWACSCGACGSGRGDLREQWARHLTEPSL